MTLHRIVYLNCELTSRDLDSRLLIAGHLATAGFTVIVGQQWAIYANAIAQNTPPGCLLLATANKNQVAVMKRFRDQGHKVICSDQEGLAFADEGFLANIHPDALSNCDAFLLQNEAHRRILAARHPDAPARLVSAGSPRIDLLYGAQRPSPLPEPYILINTSLALVNSVWGNVEAAVGRLLAGAPLPEQEIATRIAVESAAQRELLALARWLLERDVIRVVVRPHPAENIKSWESFLPPSPRLSVIAGSDPVPWIRNARLMVHAESTTGIEAAIMGAPCLNVSPDAGWSKRFTMRDINVTVPGAEEAKAPIQALLAGGIWPQKAQEVSDLYPRGGGKATAAYIGEVLAAATPLPALRWQKMQRADAQRAKFTVAGAEVQQRAAAVFGNAGLNFPAPLGFAELDDSVFLMGPRDQVPALR